MIALSKGIIFTLFKKGIHLNYGILNITEP